MNNRFKFRIWDKFCETWLTDFAINQDGEINKFFNSEEALKRRFVLMQCTGLKDKNGNLIYEGDIVRIFHLSSTGQPRTYISEVYYYKVKPSFQVKGYGFIDEDDVVEVIGNIYENKELLEECNDEV